jgi:hypothetical protein
MNLEFLPQYIHVKKGRKKIVDLVQEIGSELYKKDKKLIVDYIGYPIKFIGVWKEKDKELIQKIIQCGLIVLRHFEFMKRKPSQQIVQDLVNFDPVANWSVVHPLRRFQSAKHEIIMDPEYLVMTWSKLFETFDGEQNILLPAYPSDIITHELMNPGEIKKVVEILLMERQVLGLRNTGVPMNRRQALEHFRQTSPVLYQLLYTQDGFKVLNTVYEICTLLAKDPAQSPDTQSKCKRLIQRQIDSIIDPRLKQHMQLHNRCFVFSTGMSHPMIKPGCILTNYLSNYFFYFPEENIYFVDDAFLDEIEKVKQAYIEKIGCFYALDLNPATRKLQYVQVKPNFLWKDEFEIARKNTSIYSLQEFSDLQNWLYCASA